MRFGTAIQTQWSQQCLATLTSQGQFDLWPYIDFNANSTHQWNNMMSRNLAWRCSVSQFHGIWTVIHTGQVEYHPFIPIAFLAILKSACQYDASPEFQLFKQQLYHASISMILQPVLLGMTNPVAWSKASAQMKMKKLRFKTRKMLQDQDQGEDYSDNELEDLVQSDYATRKRVEWAENTARKRAEKQAEDPSAIEESCKLKCSQNKAILLPVTCADIASESQVTEKFVQFPKLICQAGAQEDPFGNLCQMEGNLILKMCSTTGTGVVHNNDDTKDDSGSTAIEAYAQIEINCGYFSFQSDKLRDLFYIRKLER
ncbi:hypothetical protein V8E53_003203 [Lactarius tabidus]